MATATFYTHVADSALLACRLAQKAWRSGAPVLVWLADEGEQQRFDSLLWSFEATSFVPHVLWAAGQSQPPLQAGVALACGERLPEIRSDTVVLNLADVYWCDASQTPARVLEIIGAGVDDLAAARARFRAYRQAGFAIEHHSREGLD